MKIKKCEEKFSVQANLLGLSNNRIKIEWSVGKGVFYFGTAVQFGALLDSILSYIISTVFAVFINDKHIVRIVEHEISNVTQWILLVFIKCTITE